MYVDGIKWFAENRKELEINTVFIYSIIMAASVSLGKPLGSIICSIFPLCMESNALAKSSNIIIASRIFARTPSRIRYIVNIFDVVNLFLRIPF